MKKIFNLLIALISFTLVTNARPVKPDFYQIKVYHLKSQEQLSRVDGYLKDALLPALHRFGVKNVGVFKPISNDTATDKQVYLFIPFSSDDAWLSISNKLEKDDTYLNAAKSFLTAPADDAPFTRIESILMEAFPGQPHLVVPASNNPDRVFELRSYESPTDHLHKKKMDLFNTGGEISIFNRLGFNPVFYGRVVSGSHMPNFMYMPIFENVQKRDEQWKTFVADPVWKDISTRPENENKLAVSHIDSIPMHAADYSDIK